MLDIWIGKTKWHSSLISQFFLDLSRPTVRKKNDAITWDIYKKFSLTPPKTLWFYLCALICLPFLIITKKDGFPFLQTVRIQMHLKNICVLWQTKQLSHIIVTMEVPSLPLFRAVWWHSDNNLPHSKNVLNLNPCAKPGSFYVEFPCCPHLSS